MQGDLHHLCTKKIIKFTGLIIGYFLLVGIGNKTNDKINVINEFSLNTRITRNIGDVFYSYEGRDTIDHSNTTSTGETLYTSWSDVQTSDGTSAKYSGTTAGKNYIRMRINSHSGIFSSTSGGNITNVSVTYEENSSIDRGIEVYVSNTPYTEISNLFNESKRGTLSGSLIKVDKSVNTLSLSISGNYSYVGVKSTGGVINILSLTFTWNQTTADSDDVEVVNDFITTNMKPDVDPNDTGSGKCISEGWYSSAKIAFNSLKTRQRAIILTSNSNVDIDSGYIWTYNMFKNRLLSWARNNGEALNSDNKLSVSPRFGDTIFNIDNNINFIVIAISLATIGVAFTYFAIRKKEDIE